MPRFFGWFKCGGGSNGGVPTYFTCNRPVPESCVSELEQQAEAFCRSYIPVNTATATVTVTLDLNTATADLP